MKGQPKSC